MGSRAFETQFQGNPVPAEGNLMKLSGKGSKESRVEGITGTLEAGKVYLPKEAPWLLDFERELLSFPLGRHDDQVDAFVLALAQAGAKSNAGFFIFTFGDDGPPEPIIWYDGGVRREEFSENDHPDVYLAQRDGRI